jgi:hypothetical protein
MNWEFVGNLFTWFISLFKGKEKISQITDVSGIKVESGGRINATKSSIKGEVKIPKE